MPRKTFTESVTEFLDASPWVDASHSPAVATLTALAEQLDNEIVPALVAQFGLTFRALAKEAPAAAPTEDPLEQALRQAKGEH